MVLLKRDFTLACEQALLFGRAKRAARGRRKESLQPSLTNFYLYFAHTKGNTIGWKMTFRKLKLIDNRPSRPALNFRGKCRNTMLFSPKTFPFLFPVPRSRVSSRVPLARVLFTISPKWRACSQASFTSMVTIKIFEPLKWEFQKGNRRLILNIVPKIRNLIVKSITAWRGWWCKSRKVVLMQEQIFLRHFTEPHCMKASHHPPEPSTKLLQCSTNWAMKTHTLAASQFFYFFF